MKNVSAVFVHTIKVSGAPVQSNTGPHWFSVWSKKKRHTGMKRFEGKITTVKTGTSARTSCLSVHTIHTRVNVYSTRNLADTHTHTPNIQVHTVTSESWPLNTVSYFCTLLIHGNVSLSSEPYAPLPSLPLRIAHGTHTFTKYTLLHTQTHMIPGP